MMYKFEFTKEESDLLLEALAELPAKRSYNLITNLGKQYNDQKKEQSKNNENGKVKKPEKVKK